ncbi:MAG: ATPase domain-containing protein [Candidatus Aenigmatarchaeota archaeon]
MVERVKTGIPGLDDLIAGGFPQSSTILLSGVAGAGKTIFCLQFIYNGAYVYNEPGVYISLEEEPERLINYATEEFNWNFKELIDKKMVSFVSAEMYSFEKLRDLIESEATKIKAKRLVIDPSTILGLYFEKTLEVRKSILDLTRLVKRLGCTTVLVSEIEEGSKKISGLGVEEFVVDGIIILYYIKEAGFYTRGLCVRKMRATNHDSGVHPLQITKNGLVVFPKEQIFIGKT